MPTKTQYISFTATTVLIPIFLGIIFLLYIKPTVTVKIKDQKPHIIIIIGDDMGRNDFGMFGSNQIPTPNIDALGYNGIILDRFYTQSTCSPSRTALLTGNYPIRSGLQGIPIAPGEDRSLPLDMPTMPEQLRKLGYKTHLVGKWHLGHARRENTPLGRGFDTHYGYWNGLIGYFDHSVLWEMPDTVMTGLDFFDQYEPQWSSQGQYATDLFTQKAIEIIDNHNTEAPLFLILSHLAAHAGENGTNLGVPDVEATNEKYKYIQDPKRRLYAEIINIVDGSVGQIIKKLKDKEMLQNSVVLFMSDNGAQTIGAFENSGSNWPLRGLKLSDFEGGVRGSATIFSPLFKVKGYINQELIHISDWLPTFYAIAGGNLADLGKIDGINQWDTLSQNQSSNRTEILVNINEVLDMSAIISKERNKLIKYVNNSGKEPKIFSAGSFQGSVYDQYYGDSGREPGTPPYNITAVLQSDTNIALGQPLSFDKIIQMRKQLDLAWCRNTTPFINCSNPCLFDLEIDPCETTNIIETSPDIAYKLQQRLEKFSNELVPQKNRDPDPASNPKYCNNTWFTWLDNEPCSNMRKLEFR